eukprot:jgi/Botrbrau1/6210/Bobra.0109s0005.1
MGGSHGSSRDAIRLLWGGPLVSHMTSFWGSSGDALISKKVLSMTRFKRQPGQLPLHAHRLCGARGKCCRNWVKDHYDVGVRLAAKYSWTTN